MKTQAEFNMLTKPKMVVACIEAMVFAGWEINSFVYGFRSYTKEDLIKEYKMLLEYNETLCKLPYFLSQIKV